MLRNTCSLPYIRHCEEGDLPDEAIPLVVKEIASGEYALAMTTDCVR